MFDWQLIVSLADAVNERYGLFREGARKCAKSPHFKGLSPPPRDQLFRKALKGRVRFREPWNLLDLRNAYAEQKFQDFRPGDTAYNVGEGGGGPNPISVTFEAEIDGYFFRFMNRSAWDQYRPQPLHEAQRLKRKLRRLNKVRMSAHERVAAGRLSQCRQQALWRMDERAGRIESKLRLHNQRHGKKVKQRIRIIQAGDVEALACLDYPEAPLDWRKNLANRLRLSLRHELKVLGPIVLSPRTSADEIALKIALMANRTGLCREDEAISSAVSDYLGLPLVDAYFVMQKAKASYVGDVSHSSFRSYMKRIARTVAAEGGAPRETPYPPELMDAVSSGNDGRVRRGRSPVGEVSEHPWSRGRPALLPRLALEIGIPVHQARQFYRDGKLKAQECRLREEMTSFGEKVRAKLEVEASERPRWEELITDYLSMRLRRELAKRDERRPDAARKKKLYRSFKRPGGKNDDVRRYVVQRMNETVRSGPFTGQRRTYA